MFFIFPMLMITNGSVCLIAGECNKCVYKKQFLKMVMSFYTHNSNIQEFQLLHNPWLFGAVGLFNFTHSSGYIVVFHCGFNLHFPEDEYY